MNFDKLTKFHQREFLQKHKKPTEEVDSYWLKSAVNNLYFTLSISPGFSCEQLTPEVVNLYLATRFQQKNPTAFKQYPLSQLLAEPTKTLLSFQKLFEIPFPQTIVDNPNSFRYLSDYEFLRERIIHILELLGWLQVDTLPNVTAATYYANIDEEITGLKKGDLVITESSVIWIYNGEHFQTVDRLSRKEFQYPNFPLNYWPDLPFQYIDLELFREQLLQNLQYIFKLEPENRLNWTGQKIIDSITQRTGTVSYFKTWIEHEGKKVNFLVPPEKIVEMTQSFRERLIPFLQRLQPTNISRVGSISKEDRSRKIQQFIQKYSDQIDIFFSKGKIEYQPSGYFFFV